MNYASKKGKLTYRQAMSLGSSKNVYRVSTGKISQRKVRNARLGQTVKEEVIYFRLCASREYHGKKR